MRQSFLAVVSHFGLESLVPECKLTYCWALRAVEQRPASCLWTVMEPSRARDIHDLLSAGEEQWALDELALAAEFMGPVWHPFIRECQGAVS